MDFFVKGSRTGLSAQEARDVARARMPAVARPYDKADWSVTFLTASPEYDGQEAFELSRVEREALEEWKKASVYVNLHHFAAARKAEIEQYMQNLLEMLNDAESPRNRDDCKKLLDDAAVKWAAWQTVRASL